MCRVTYNSNIKSAQVNEDYWRFFFPRKSTLILVSNRFKLRLINNTHSLIKLHTQVSPASFSLCFHQLSSLFNLCSDVYISYFFPLFRLSRLFFFSFFFISLSWLFVSNNARTNNFYIQIKHRGECNANKQMQLVVKRTSPKAYGSQD
jgi:hypothetical protein